MLTHPDFKELLSVLNAHNVRYLVVGGYAVMKYSEPRFTKDLDLWISIDPENARAVFAALQDFGAPLSGLTEESFSKEGCFYQMGVPPLRVDVMMSLPGMTFEEAWPRRVMLELEETSIPFVSKEDLIRIKRASGRSQDLLDAKRLESETE
ncbi:MAG: hypothetical protein EHM18_08625 [Acidobacteria bacterium]|nr:MAG: hypothetical protein EHM18_08625 [Acidobacteriota bacterium]